MESSLQYNGDYIQRRKMYPISHRHNLRSNAELYWLGSMQFGNPDPNRIMGKKKEVGYDELRQSYNRYVDRQVENGFHPQQQLSPVSNPQQNLSSYTPPPKKLKTIEPHNLYKDETLNKEIQNFNTNGSSVNSSRIRSIQHTPQKINYDSQEQRLQNLRSALDKPIVFENRFKPKQKLFKNVNNDKLQNFLRINLKKSTRY